MKIKEKRRHCHIRKRVVRKFSVQNGCQCQSCKFKLHNKYFAYAREHKIRDADLAHAHKPHTTIEKQKHKSDNHSCVYV